MHRGDLVVNWLSVPTMSGQLALMAAPGRTDHRVKRNLDQDAKKLRQQHQVSLMVSVMDQSDYPRMYSGRNDSFISSIYEREGIQHRVFYIRNMSIPSEMTTFDALVESILQDLASGKNVGIHCIHGRGRTGLTAAGCLIKLGVPAFSAMELVRAARKGTISHRIQEQFLQRYQEYVESLIPPSSPRTEEKIEAPEDEKDPILNPHGILGKDGTGTFGSK